MTTMSFSGKNLDRVRSAIEDALFWQKGEITSCPDVGQYSEELKEMDAKIAGLQSLLNRIDKKLQKESKHEGP